MSKKLKIIICHTQNKATAKLRLLQPAEAMYNAGLIDVPEVLSFKELLQNTELIKKADIIWFQAYLDQLFLRIMLDARRINPKLKLVFDMDDNMFAITKANPCFTQFCTEETVELVDGTVIRIPDPYGNRISLRICETLLREVDAIIVTTKYLANVYYKYNKNIYMEQNSLHEKHWYHPHIPIRDDGFIKVGWQGGNTHILDWNTAHIPLRDTLNKYKNVKLEMITTPGIFDMFMQEYPKEQFKFYDFLDYDAHAWRMNILKPDIGICPLNEDEFSVCKSDLKFTEYATLGIPVIATNIPPYKDSIIHGETGFLAYTEQEWKNYLALLIEDKELRLYIGKNAQEWAKENRGLLKTAGKWYNIMKEISEAEPWLYPQMH